MELRQLGHEERVEDAGCRGALGGGDAGTARRVTSGRRRRCCQRSRVFPLLDVVVVIVVIVVVVPDRVFHVFHWLVVRRPLIGGK